MRRVARVEGEGDEMDRMVQEVKMIPWVRTSRYAYVDIFLRRLASQ